MRVFGLLCSLNNFCVKCSWLQQSWLSDMPMAGSRCMIAFAVCDECVSTIWVLSCSQLWKYRSALGAIHSHPEERLPQTQLCNVETMTNRCFVRSVGQCICCKHECILNSIYEDTRAKHQQARTLYTCTRTRLSNASVSPRSRSLLSSETPYTLH